MVKTLLEKNPELTASTAKYPKKDLGQSPLQAALKSGNSAAADHLLDLGADVNFMEAEDCGGLWRAPVLLDAINAAVMCTRWNVNGGDGLRILHTMEESETAYGLLHRMTDGCRCKRRGFQGKFLPLALLPPGPPDSLQL